MGQECCGSQFEENSSQIATANVTSARQPQFSEDTNKDIVKPDPVVAAVSNRSVASAAPVKASSEVIFTPCSEGNSDVFRVSNNAGAKKTVNKSSGIQGDEKKWASIQVGDNKLFQVRHGGSNQGTGCRWVDTSSSICQYEEVQRMPKSSQEFTMANLDNAFIFVMGGGSESR